MKTPDFEQFMAKIKAMEKGEKLDLSSDEDLSIAIMNLISIEEHFFLHTAKPVRKVFRVVRSGARNKKKSLKKNY